MNSTEETWGDRLHAAVDDHPGALAFDVRSYVAAGRTRARRNRAAAVVAAALVAAAVAVVATVALGGPRGAAPQPLPPAVPDITVLGPGANGWLAVDAYEDVYLVRPGQNSHRLEFAGSAAGGEACPAWSPDGTRLLLGRVTGASDATAGRAELVIVPVGQDGAAGTPTLIGLDDFEVLDGFDTRPCGTWAPDGRWVALSGAGEVWVVDTQTGEIRRLPDLRPSDLEWRPGTDELAIAGDMGPDRSAPTVSTPVTLYSVSTGELRRLGSGEAAHVTWSPNGTTLGYTGGEDDAQELWLVDGDGANERLIVAQLGEANHGIGPVWSPTGERIAYQRLLTAGAELHEVVLVNVADGTESVIEPPEADGQVWYPYAVSWSPDGSTLLYSAWSDAGAGFAVDSAVIAVSADVPTEVTVLTKTDGPSDNYSHRWAPIQMWGRQPD